MIKVQLLGGASLRSGDVPLAGPPAQRHRIALLSLIVASWPQPLSATGPWRCSGPSGTLAKARRLLNLAVHVLRSTLGDDSIVSTGDGSCSTPPSTCDLHELRAPSRPTTPSASCAATPARCWTGFTSANRPSSASGSTSGGTSWYHAYTGALRMVAEGQERGGDVHGRVSTSAGWSLPPPLGPSTPGH